MKKIIYQLNKVQSTLIVENLEWNNKNEWHILKYVNEGKSQIWIFDVVIVIRSHKKIPKSTK